MICKQCGNEFQDGKNFCPKCGIRVGNEKIDKQAKEEISSTVNITSSTGKNENETNKKTFDFLKNKKIAVISVTSIIVLILIVLFVNIFSNHVPNESKIKKDLVGKTFFMDDMEEAYKIKDGEVKKIEIIKRTTNKKDKIDDVFVKIQLSDGKISMDGDLELNYVYYDKGGWILSDQIQNLTDGGFKYTPIDGVDETFVKKSLIGQSIAISENDSWNIDENDIKDLKITDHSSQLNNNIDNISFDLSLQSNTAIATGKVNAIYKFDKKNWVLQQVKREETDDFEYSFITGLEPNFDEEKIKKDIIGQQIILTNAEGYTIKQEELKELKIRSKVVSNKGEFENISTSILIQNGNVTIKGNLVLKYSFSEGNGWVNNIDNSANEPLEIIYNIIGGWNGTYKVSQGETKLNLSINSIDNNGVITDAVFKFSATASNPNVPSGSFRMKGNYDRIKNVISLQGIEWIEQPSGYIFVDMVGNIDISKNQFSGKVDNFGTFNLQKK